MQANIRIEGLMFGYGNDTNVLDDICLNISDAQLISIIGPNGVGKSTLIHCMNKILSPSEGAVFVDNKNIKDYTIKELAKKMGYVPHVTGDSFPMTVMDTVLMGRHPHVGHKISNEDVDEAYNILKILEIEHLAMRPFNELSAGQHQKVALARGIAQKPRILLLDEPTSNLDIKHQMDVARILKQMSISEDMIIIMICHDLNIAAKYSDNVIMLHDGAIHAIGTPSEVITEENLKVVYNVDSTIIFDDDRPHVILKDRLFDTNTESSESVVCMR